MDKTPRRARLSITLTCGLLTVATPALGQGPAAPAPSGGLYAATRSDTASGDRLNFEFAVSEAFDSDVAVEHRARLLRSDSPVSGFSTMVMAFADYAHTRRRLQLGGSASTGFRYHQRLGEVTTISHSAGLGATVRLPKRATLHINQTAAYSPSYLYQLFPTSPIAPPEEAIPVELDYQIEETESYFYGTRMSLAMGSTRTQITTTAEYDHTNFQRDILLRPDLTTYAGGAKVSRRLSRDSRALIEYQYRAGQYWLDELTREHQATVGIEYSRPLSATRRATFRFTVSPGTLQLPEPVVQSIIAESTASEPGEATPLDRTVFRVGGEGSVDYQFRRGWVAEANYRRGVEYLAVLVGPLLSDAARVRLAGLITRRVDVAASAGYATGASALSRNPEKLNTYTGEIRIRYALKRSLALYSEYLYYHYDLGGQARLAPGLPTVFNQHGVRIGVMLFVPTLDR